STTTSTTVPASPSNPGSSSGTSTTTSTTVPASPSNPGSSSGTSTTTSTTVPASPSNPGSSSGTSTTTSTTMSDGQVAAPEAPVVGNNTQEAAVMEQLNTIESKKPYFRNYQATQEVRVEISYYNRVDTHDTPSSGVQASRVVIERNNNNTGPDYNPDYNPDIPN
ncbi:MAG: hypothetical protein JNK86_07460, partial [Alphaproteobacteria bacterium]|nr:hypothetical protein [Alphaproteobacteria bacterium]